MTKEQAIANAVEWLTWDVEPLKFPDPHIAGRYAETLTTLSVDGTVWGINRIPDGYWVVEKQSINR